MTREPLERRLTAILAADVAGYSRLTGVDEEGTHVRLKEHLRVLVDPKIAAHRGRIVKNTGDGFFGPTHHFAPRRGISDSPEPQALNVEQPWLRSRVARREPQPILSIRELSRRALTIMLT